MTPALHQRGSEAWAWKAVRLLPRVSRGQYSQGMSKACHPIETNCVINLNIGAKARLTKIDKYKREYPGKDTKSPRLVDEDCRCFCLD